MNFTELFKQDQFLNNENNEALLPGSCNFHSLVFL
jgi:hypothetical protein